MKTILQSFTLTFLLSIPAIADSSLGQFLGSSDLGFTSQIWSPVENIIQFKDTAADKYYADFHFTTQQEIHVLLRPGTTYAFECDSSKIITKYFLVELDTNGKELNSQFLDSDEFRTKESANYLVRVAFEGVKKCSGYGTSLIALLR